MRDPLEHSFRHDSGWVTAHLVRQFGPENWHLIEEGVQEAFVKAMPLCAYGETASIPRSWLLKVARNSVIDSLRRDSRHTELREDLAGGDVPATDGVDAEIQMLFGCCEPGLPPESRIALTLKALGGLSTREVARALVITEHAAEARIVRAKRRVATIPGWPELSREAQPERLTSVLAVLYLIFNEGYSRTRDPDEFSIDLCDEAILLGQRLRAQVEFRTEEIDALMALMLFQSSRLSARGHCDGELILLKDQDRSKWDWARIGLAFHHFDRCMQGSELSCYHVEASIAAAHAAASSFAETDWEFILEQYDLLMALRPTPVVRLNRIMALSYARSPELALTEFLSMPMDSVLARTRSYEASLADLRVRIEA